MVRRITPEAWLHWAEQQPVLTNDQQAEGLVYLNYLTARMLALWSTRAHTNVPEYVALWDYLGRMWLVLGPKIYGPPPLCAQCQQEMIEEDRETGDDNDG